MHYYLPIGQFDKTKPCQFSSIQLRRSVSALSLIEPRFALVRFHRRCFQTERVHQLHV